MNNTYFPIVGEISFKEKKFVINVIFFSDVDLPNLKGSKCTCQKFILPTTEIATIGEFTFDPTKYNESIRINTLNCDCQLISECGLKDEVKLESFNFHLGDQIYLDEVFLKSLHKKDFNTKEQVYLEYKRAFLRKKDILQKSFNVMLGDDHEITDETFRIFDKSNQIKIFRDAFEDIQRGLRLSNDTVISFGDQDFLLVDNIDILPSKEYSKNITRLLVTSQLNSKNLFILTARNITNVKNNQLNKIIYSSDDNTTNYKDFYDRLFDLAKSKKVTVICGDEHCSAKFLLQRNDTIIDYYLNGPLNSIPEIFDDKYFLKTEEIKVEYLLNQYGFIEIENGIIEHKLMDSNCLCVPIFQYAFAVIPEKIKVKYCC